MLLAIPVAANTGGGVGPLGVTVICVLAVLLIAACGIVSRPYALQVILGLQVVMIACWLITPPLGIMGIVFGVVWAISCGSAASSGAGWRPVRCLGRRNRAVSSRPLAGGDRAPVARHSAAARGRPSKGSSRPCLRYQCRTNPGPDQARRRRAGTGRRGHLPDRAQGADAGRAGAARGRAGRRAGALRRARGQGLLRQPARVHHRRPAGRRWSSRGRGRSPRSGSSPAAPTRWRRPPPAASAATSAWRPSSTWCTAPIRRSPRPARSGCGSRTCDASRRAARAGPTAR